MRTQTMRKIATGGLVAGLLTLASGVPRAQLAAPGPGGVVMGHLHLSTKDADTSRRFWAALGGIPIQNGPLQLIQLPGTFVMLRNSQEIAGGSQGSTVERIVLRVRTAEIPALFQKIGQAIGAQVTDSVFTSPEGVSIEIRGATTQEAPVQMERVVFRTVAPTETRDWYVKTFGAASDSLPQIPIAVLPGVLMYFMKADAPPAGTRGRALDHIGFEVKNLEAFCKKLEAAGQNFDRPYGKLANSETAIAFITDPWGTYIELTENLAPAK